MNTGPTKPQGPGIAAFAVSEEFDRRVRLEAGRVDLDGTAPSRGGAGSRGRFEVEAEGWILGGIQTARSASNLKLKIALTSGLRSPRKTKGVGRK